MDNIFETLDSPNFRKRLEPVMLYPKKIDRFLGIVRAELKSNPRLANCEMTSLCGAIVKAGQFGLDLDSVQGHAYLTSKGNGCLLIVGYKGMIALGFRSGKLLSMEVENVCKNDFFEMEHGDNKGLRHKPKPTQEERGEVIGYYAYAHLINNDKIFKYMNIDEIEELKKKAGVIKTPNSAWGKFEDQMSKKTVVRQLFKYQTLSSEMDSVIGLDEMADAGVQSDALREIGKEFIVDEPTTKVNDILLKKRGQSQENENTTKNITTIVA